MEFCSWSGEPAWWDLATLIKRDSSWRLTVLGLIPHTSEDIRLKLWEKSYKEKSSKLCFLTSAKNIYRSDCVRNQSPRRAGTIGTQQVCLEMMWKKLWWFFLVKEEWFFFFFLHVSKKGTPSCVCPGGGVLGWKPPHPFPPLPCFLLEQIVADVPTEPNSPWSPSLGAEPLCFRSKKVFYPTYLDHLPQLPVPMSKCTG